MRRLSNTATPYYYGIFRDKVINGEIPICDEIAMEMNRIDELIANPGVYYDPDAMNGFVKYCETELTTTDGDDLHLLDTFKLWAEQIFCWYYFVDRSVYVPNSNGGGKFVRKRIKKRLIKKQYLIVGRGAGKSIYASCIHSYFLNVLQKTTKQVSTAPTMIQADEVLSPIRTSIIRSRGPLFKFLTLGSIQNTTGKKSQRVKLASTKKGIENFITGSILEIRPMSIAKLQGLRITVATLDEWLSCEIREDPISALEQGASKEQSDKGDNDYIIIAMSSEGTVRNGVGDSIKMELMEILKGNYVNPHVSIWYYRLNHLEDVGDPSKWIMANPNLGITVSYETIQQDVERAEKNPSARNDILAKRFNIPLEGYTYFFTYEETIPIKGTRTYWGMNASLGTDLSQGDDFCGFTFLFPLGGETYGVKTRCYISEKTMMQLQRAAYELYCEFIEEGTLIVLHGSTLDLDEVYEDLEKHIEEMQYNVCAHGYDPYNAKDFIERWSKENGPFGIEKVPQGYRTETVPLGELKKLATSRALIFDEQMMKFCMGNCITMEDTNGNRKLLKKRYADKIDSVSALMDAYVAYKANKEAFD